jgi:hypothetical protein
MVSLKKHADGNYQIEGRYRVIHKSPGTSELGCATTKTDTAERIISMGRESLHAFLCLPLC